MAAIFSFKCASCDDIHEGSPSFAFHAPDPFLAQPKAVQTAGQLGSDLCRYEDQRPFIVLEETDHPLSVDYRQGISVQRAQEIAEAAMHGTA